MIYKLFISGLAIFGLLALMVPVNGVVPVAVVTPVSIQNFECGKGLTLYKAYSYDQYYNPIGQGIRCVKYTANVIGQIGFGYYAEGYSSKCTYRSVGQGIFKQLESPPVYNNALYRISQADIWGNGECRKNNYYSNELSASITDDKNTIKVSQDFGASFKETWVRQLAINYSPMGRITTCGNTIGLDQFTAKDGPNGAINAGLGLRCVLKLSSVNSVWFGNGWWWGLPSTYSEIGVRHPTLGYGVSNIFGGGRYGFGIFNDIKAYGSLQISWGVHSALFLAPNDEYWS
jgi:hypothetical protein